MPALTEKPETVSFQVKIAGIDIEATAYADRLYEAGCQDALVFIEDGSLFVDFDRQAPSFDLAINSAIENITQAGGTIQSVHRLPPPQPGQTPYKPTK